MVKVFLSSFLLGLNNPRGHHESHNEEVARRYTQENPFVG